MGNQSSSSNSKNDIPVTASKRNKTLLKFPISIKGKRRQRLFHTRSDINLDDDRSDSENADDTCLGSSHRSCQSGTRSLPNLSSSGGKKKRKKKSRFAFTKSQSANHIDQDLDSIIAFIEQVQKSGDGQDKLENVVVSQLKKKAGSQSTQFFLDENQIVPSRKQPSIW